MSKDPNFPAMLWNAKGEHRVFKGAHEIPKDETWHDHPAKHKEPAPAPVPDHDPPAPAVEQTKLEPPALKTEPAKPEPPMPREEITAALDAGGVAYRRNASTRNLYDLLVTTLKGVLKERNIAFDDAADAKTLLELLPPQV